MSSKFTITREYNSKGNKVADGWPSLYRAINNENWSGAAGQSLRRLNANDIVNKNNPRNVFTKEQFEKAKNGK